MESKDDVTKEDTKKIGEVTKNRWRLDENK